MKKIFMLAAVVGLAVGLSIGAYYYFCDTYHFGIVQPGVLYRSGLQGMRRFANAYRQHPFKCVINIQSQRDVDVQYHEQSEAEKRFCAEHQVHYIHIPMNPETPPTSEQVDAFIAAVSDPANQPALVHDSQGVIREGMMVAVWQMEKMNYDTARALREINWWGHGENRQLLEFVKAYVPRHAPSKSNGE
jgi:hypothetical protein